jgi:hypothetical protein
VRTEQLEYRAAVTQLGALRRAADELRLERKRYGATMSAEGRELLPCIVHVLEAVDRLRVASGEQHRISRMVRVGTVGAQQTEIQRTLSEGGSTGSWTAAPRPSRTPPTAPRWAS